MNTTIEELVRKEWAEYGNGAFGSLEKTIEFCVHAYTLGREDVRREVVEKE